MAIDVPIPPQEYSLAIADAVIFHSPEDVERAEGFMAKVMELMKDEPLNVTLYLHDHLENQGTALQSVEKVCDISVLRFFYVTDNLIADREMRFHKDEQVLKSVMQDMRHFIPVWSKKKNEFAKLPYGLGAYTGLYESDPRLSKKLSSLFCHEDHLRNKQQLQEQQEEAKKQWLEIETRKTEEEKRMQQEKHEQRLQQMREEVRQNVATMPTSDEELVFQHSLQNMMRTTTPPSPPSPPSPHNSSISSADGAMPDYLFRSLESARSQHRRVVYNITINQPHTVNIGDAGGAPSSATRHADQGAAVKNIVTDADNPNLNLTEREPPISVPVQESRSNSSSFEVVPTPSTEQ